MKMRIRDPKVALALAFALLGAAASAQEAKYSLEEVVVTATRTPNAVADVPAAVEVITPDELDRAQARDVSHLLEEVAGVQVQRYGAVGQQSGVRLRGLSSERVLVLVDGRPLNVPNLGMADLSGISASAVQRIEIVRGPGSALYGANALGGVVNILTGRPPAGRSASLRGTYGAWDTSMGGLQAGWRGPKLGSLLTLDAQDTDGERDNSEYALRGGQIQLDVPFGSTMLELDIGGTDKEAGRPGPRPSGIDTLRSADQVAFGNSSVSSLRDRAEAQEWHARLAVAVGNLRINSYHNDQTSMFERHTTYPTPETREDNDHQLDYSGLEVQWDWEALEGASMLTVGGFLGRDKFAVNRSTADTAADTAAQEEWDASRTSHALFLQETFHLGPGVGSIGIRWDDYDDFGSRVSPRLGALWHVSEEYSLWTGWGMAFRAPTLNALNWPDDGTATGNPSLKPEESWSAEIGARVQLRRASVSVTAFHQEVTDLIAWAPVGPESPIPFFGPKWTPDNLNKKKTSGVELGIESRLGEHMSLSWGSSLLHSRQTTKDLVDDMAKTFASSTRDAIFVPRHEHELGLHLDSVAGFGLQGQMRYVAGVPNYYSDYSAWPTISYNEKELAGHMVVNLRVNRSWKPVEVYLAAENLFDEQYATQFGQYNDRDYPAAGRCVTLGAILSY